MSDAREADQPRRSEAEEPATEADQPRTEAGGPGTEVGGPEPRRTGQDDGGRRK